ncbi:hypothetical protein HRG_012505 [Hirsutella rhossiliensis]
MSANHGQYPEPKPAYTIHEGHYRVIQSQKQHLLGNGVFPEGYAHPDGRATPEPANLDSVHQALLLARASLSPSRFSESAYRDFKRKNKTNSEGTVMRSLVPIIAGTADIPNEGHLPFTNLESLTKEATVKAVPDFFDGAHPETVNREVSRALSQMIIPTKLSGVPAAPNFFLEAKASKGDADVALRQACLDGAYGARAVDARSYGKSEPACYGLAYTYSSTYHDGTLKLYAHQAQAPASSGGRPEYHMTKIRGFDMTDNRNTFVAGETAFRNTRDLAKRHRDNLIRAANAKIALEGAVAAEGGCSRVPRARSTEWKDAHDALWKQIAGRRSAMRIPSQPVLDLDGPFTSTCSEGTVRTRRHRLTTLSVDSSPQEHRPSKGLVIQASILKLGQGIAGLSALRGKRTALGTEQGTSKVGGTLCLRNLFSVVVRRKYGCFLTALLQVPANKQVTAVAIHYLMTQTSRWTNGYCQPVAYVDNAPGRRRQSVFFQDGLRHGSKTARPLSVYIKPECDSSLPDSPRHRVLLQPSPADVWFILYSAYPFSLSTRCCNSRFLVERGFTDSFQPSKFVSLRQLRDCYPVSEFCPDELCFVSSGTQPLVFGLATLLYSAMITLGM